jgi:hypothetical protein
MIMKMQKPYFRGVHAAKIVTATVIALAVAGEDGQRP